MFGQSRLDLNPDRLEYYGFQSNQIEWQLLCTAPWSQLCCVSVVWGEQEKGQNVKLATKRNGQSEVTLIFCLPCNAAVSGDAIASRRKAPSKISPLA